MMEVNLTEIIFVGLGISGALIGTIRYYHAQAEKMIEQSKNEIKEHVGDVYARKDDVNLSISKIMQELAVIKVGIQNLLERVKREEK